MTQERVIGSLRSSISLSFQFPAGTFKKIVHLVLETTNCSEPNGKPGKHGGKPAYRRGEIKSPIPDLRSLGAQFTISHADP